MHTEWCLCAVNPVLRDHCDERPSVWTEHIFLAKKIYISIYKGTCYRRPPVLTDHLFVGIGVEIFKRLPQFSSNFNQTFMVSIVIRVEYKGVAFLAIWQTKNMVCLQSMFVESEVMNKIF